jgi:predicted nucleic acid-binding Zn ribbon protein
VSESLSDIDEVRRKRIRRNTIVLLLVAAAFYVGFIVMSVMRGQS